MFYASRAKFAPITSNARGFDCRESLHCLSESIFSFTASALLPVFLREYPSVKKKAVEHIGSPTNIEQYACRKCGIEYSLSEFPMKECKQGAEHNKPCSREIGFQEVTHAQYDAYKAYKNIDCLPYSFPLVFHRIEKQKDKERC